MKQIILVPGVGKAERSIASRIFAMYLRRHGTMVHVFQPAWSSDESAETKVERLCRLMEECTTSESTKIILVGYSAGATLSLTSFFRKTTDISRVFLVSGKLRGSRSIGMYYRDKYPALYGVVRLSEEILPKLNEDDRRKILTTQPIVDLLVPVREMRINSTKNTRLLAFTHPMGIGIGLLMVMRKIAKKH